VLNTNVIMSVAESAFVSESSGIHVFQKRTTLPPVADSVLEIVVHAVSDATLMEQVNE